MNKLKFSICLPSYNGEHVIGDTIRSILSQSFDNFELIIIDDNSSDRTEDVVLGFKDARIRFSKNDKNLGYPGNLEECRKKAVGDIIYLMGQDDILAENALMNTYKAFMISDDIGAVTRPFFMFLESIEKPVRVRPHFYLDRDAIVTINDGFESLVKTLRTLDQLSGLAMRKKYIDIPFHKDVFPCHVYPFASIMKKYPIVFLKDYNVAVRISSSQTRSVGWIYDKSPLQSWVEFYNNVFFEPEFNNIRKKLIRDYVAVNYVGLVQIRNYSKYKYLLREVFLLLKYRWYNIFVPAFWSFSLVTMFLPRFILIPFADLAKKLITSKFVIKLDFKYKL